MLVALLFTCSFVTSNGPDALFSSKNLCIVFCLGPNCANSSLVNVVLAFSVSTTFLSCEISISTFCKSPSGSTDSNIAVYLNICCLTLVN